MTTLPHSPETEKHVLATCLLDEGPTYQRALDAGVTDNSFHDPKNRIIWKALGRVPAPALELLVPELGEHFETVGGMPYLMEITSGIATTAHAGPMIEKLREIEDKRIVIRRATELIEHANNGTSLEELSAQAKDIIPSPRYTGLKSRPLTDFNLPAKDDPSVLIGNRWLSRGDIFILASTSGMGKSSLSIQAALTWGLGLPLFGGFHPRQPLKSLIFQAEDGDGDIAEVRHSIEHAMKLTDEQKATVKSNVLIVTDRIHRGLGFRAEIIRQLAIHKPDLVWINPLLAFIGGDVNDSTDVGLFIREQLNSLNEPPTFAYGIVHHTSKPPKERKERQWNEVMYEMAGSAELTNASRAILALQASETEGEFKLILAKRGIRAGLTKPVPQGVGFRQEPTITVTLRHSKDRMDVEGQNLPVIFWERGDDPAAKSKGGRKPSHALDKVRHKFPTESDRSCPIAKIHKDCSGLDGMTYNGFKKAVIRMWDDGTVKMVEKPGLGPCFFWPDTEPTEPTEP